MDEKQILCGLKSKDENALKDLIRYFTPLISSIIYNMSKGSLEASDIEEICADTFISVWFNTDKIKEGCLKGFICTTAKNKAIDRLRKIKGKETVSLDDPEIEDDITPADTLEKEDTSRILSEAVKALGEPDSEIVFRRYYYYQSINDISTAMGIKLSTVKSKLRRANEKLRKNLKERGFIK